ncbi:MAG: hypothetical protein H6581_18075 [Bacteroidia bacterium]|nr:hypothetical protein [Bacteroidia bacterium]
MKNRTETYKTILVLAAAALVAHFVFDKTWLIYLSLGLMVISLISGWVADKISWLWLKFAEILGNVNSKVILGVIFFIFLTPLAFLYRLMGKNSMQLKRKGQGESYFTERNHTYTAKDLKNLW